MRKKLCAGSISTLLIPIYFLLEKIVSSRPQAKAYRLEKIDDRVRETPLETIYLGENNRSQG